MLRAYYVPSANLKPLLAERSHSLSRNGTSIMSKAIGKLRRVLSDVVGVIVASRTVSTGHSGTLESISSTRNGDTHLEAVLGNKLQSCAIGNHAE